MQDVFRRFARGLPAIVGGMVLVGGLLAVPAPVQARVWIGFGVPLFVAPAPYYYPPPPPVYVYPAPVYPPPPAYYAPPPPPGYVPYQPGAPSSVTAQSCYAGAYVCPMETPVSPGSACYCTGSNGVRVWGSAN